ncbi:MAG: transcriptional regulator [Ilumatobacteraceae bacterium]|nr:transcriptional regulator [Ilumatobacteraceae bacterium]
MTERAERAERAELADFLRARREQLRPQDVGLRDAGRRRTPGLRREEVATLAGVSIDYLVRLEQGRDIHPSAAVIAALADALQLDEPERHHLAKLALIGSNRELCPATSPLVVDVVPTVELLLERLLPTPAFVVGPAKDVLSFNSAWATLVRPLGLLDASRPNLARYVFLHPMARRSYPDWSWAADEQVGRLRDAALRWGDDPHVVTLLDLLGGVPEFASRWAQHPVSEKRRGTRRIDHPRVGELRVAYEIMQLADGDQRLVTWLPGDDASAGLLTAALADGDAGGAPQLRVVRDA